MMLTFAMSKKKTKFNSTILLMTKMTYREGYKIVWEAFSSLRVSRGKPPLNCPLILLLIDPLIFPFSSNEKRQVVEMKNSLDAVVSYVNKEIIAQGETPFTKETVDWERVPRDFDWPEGFLES